MRDDDVPWDEMRWFPPHRDEIDAVLGDQVLDEDLIDVAEIVHELRSAYLSDDRLTRQPALAAFTGALLDDNGEPLATAASNAHGSAQQTAGLPNRAPETGGRRSMIPALSTLTATLVGKIALGTAVAAASVGGLHATDVVDVPGLPDRASEQAVVATQDVPDTEGDGDADGDEAVTGLQVDGEAFSLEMQAWSTCVDEASAAHDEAMADHDASVDGPPGRFDPEDACGDRPQNPAAENAPGPPEEIESFVASIRDWSDCVAEHAPEHAAECEKPDAPGAGDDVASEVEDLTEGRQEGAGQPEDTPVGPLEDTPVGPLEDTPDGPLEDTPVGQPEDTPAGPPAG